MASGEDGEDNFDHGRLGGHLCTMSLCRELWRLYLYLLPDYRHPCTTAELLDTLCLNNFLVALNCPKKPFI